MSAFCFNGRYRLHLLFCIFGGILASCGVNKVPEASDIQRSLQEQFGTCQYSKNFKISNSSKLNGRDLGDGRYSVQQEFEAEFIPPSEFKKKIEESRSAAKVYTEFLETFVNPKSEAIEVEKREGMARFSNELSQKRMELQKFKDSEEYVSLENAVELWSRQEKQQIEESYRAKKEALNTQINEERIKRGFDKVKDVESLAMEMRRNIEVACGSTISRLGSDMLFKLIGYDGSSQANAFENGVKMKMTLNSVYVKTEKGWMLQ